MKKKTLITSVVCIIVALVSVLFGALGQGQDNGASSQDTTREAFLSEQNTQAFALW